MDSREVVRNLVSEVLKHHPTAFDPSGRDTQTHSVSQGEDGKWDVHSSHNYVHSAINAIGTHTMNFNPSSDYGGVGWFVMPKRGLDVAPPAHTRTKIHQDDINW